MTIEYLASIEPPVMSGGKMSVLGMVLVGTFYWSGVVFGMTEPGVEGQWLMRIQHRFDKHCFVIKISEKDRLFGFNGVMRATWLVKTCEGERRFRVSYYPASSFPYRWDPYEVIAVQ